MQPIPADILMQFNAVLIEKAVPSSLHEDYRKWLKYYLDFRVKYPPPDIKSEQVRLFIEKMFSPTLLLSLRREIRTFVHASRSEFSEH